MATAAGYLVLEGISFEQLVWFCARAFIERDDESLDIYDESRIASAKEFLDEARADLDRLISSSDEDLQQQRDEAFAVNERGLRETCVAWKRENGVIDSMLQMLEGWQPPPLVPAELKAYLIEQMRISKHPEPDTWLADALMRARAWPSRDEGIARLKKRIEQEERSLALVCRGLARRQTWVRQLEQQIPRPANFDPPGK